MERTDSGTAAPVRVEVIGCAKTFPDGTRALRATSLVIEPGEVLALLGPSGCGKTTLLRLIAGLETADPGARILFDGEDVSALPIERRGVGMVFQHYALFPQMTVAANIGYGLRIRGMPLAQRRERVDELIELVRLQGLAHKRPAELSGGQRQRVALARAVAIRPRVLLLDEPLTALDAKLKEQLRDELAELLRRLRITTVHVTHDQQEALAIADRLAIMRGGQLIGVGAGEALYRDPGHPFLAEFLGRVNRVPRDANARTAGEIVVADRRWPCPPALQACEAVLVRPEDVQLGLPATDTATLSVIRRVFLGERVQLQLAAGPLTLMAEVMRDSPIRVGDTVGVRIEPARWIPWFAHEARDASD